MATLGKGHQQQWVNQPFLHFQGVLRHRRLSVLQIQRVDLPGPIRVGGIDGEATDLA